MLRSKEFSKRTFIQEWVNGKVFSQFMVILILCLVNSILWGQDNLGNHTATQNLNLNGHWLSGDGENEGIFVTQNGNVGIGKVDPGQKLMVKNGNFYIIRTDELAAKLFLQTNSTTECPVIRLADTQDGKNWNISNYFSNNQFRLSSYNGSEWKQPFKIDIEAPTNSIYVDPNGKVGIGVGNPTEQLEVSGTIYASDSDVAIYGKATDYDGIGLMGEASMEEGRGVYGIASGEDGYGVYGEASYWDNGMGVYGKSSGKNGTGVRGIATNTGDGRNYGGHFTAWGARGEGVIGVANGSEAKAVVGYSSNSGNVENYGGHFQASGERGVGVYGYASSSDNDEQINYGGYFVANGEAGVGVYGFGASTDGNTHYGGYFEALGNTSVGVYGTVAGAYAEAVHGWATGSQGRGGYFYAGGINGRGVDVLASGNDGYGGYFRATGTNGVGLYAEGGANGLAGVFSGKIICKEVEVTLTGFPDFVFEESYELMPLEEVEQHIKENKHLPDIPSEKEVLENGLGLGEMQAKLLQKIEELTLYMIELKKENEALYERLSLLEKINEGRK